MNFVRSFAGVRDDCRLGPRTQFNLITSYIDANFLYGSSVRVADSLRTLQGGTMSTLPIFRRLGLRDLLPLKLTFPDDGCIRPSKDIFCFLAAGRTCDDLGIFGGRFRANDGSCNNLEHPTWGSARISFRRFLPPEYGDGKQSFTNLASSTAQVLTTDESRGLLLSRDTKIIDHLDI
ncbi:hypothetical protein J437_LFUL017508 [Ladona fulva]|uniref:Uncharacterized protein n=1 Tax=Ladona fulva TaxID=123851 RepID=A0A8K0KPT7_LADFU|nr:hypothetical protein J437_LFUL017508 [Ladona fulva]